MKAPSMIPPSRSEASGTASSSPDTAQTQDHRYAVREIFREFFPDYVKRHSVSFHKQKVVNAVMSCGTGELGYTVSVCPECRGTQIRGNTCGNRNCPSCGLTRQLQWRAQREAEHIYGIPYYHVVFTLPHVLTDLIIQNQKALLGLLFRSASRSMLDLCGEKHGMIPGIVMVLHTCGGNMLPHYHIHMLVSGGGLTQDKTSFVRLREGQFFLPVKLLAGRYRSIYMSSLKQFRDDNALSFSGFAQKYRNSYEWKELVDKCYGTDWNVEIRPYPPAQEPCTRGDDPKRPSNTAGAFADYAMMKTAAPARIPGSTDAVDTSVVQEPPLIDAVHQYMAQYTNRSAVTDDRILSCSSTSVVIECKVHHRGGYTTKEPLILSPDEFIRRFLLNIPPKGFARTRFAGFLAGCVKARNLALIRELLDQKQPLNPTKEMKAAELVLFFYGNDFSRCPACHVPMKVLGHRLCERRAAARIRAS